MFLAILKGIATVMAKVRGYPKYQLVMRKHALTCVALIVLGACASVSAVPDDRGEAVRTEVSSRVAVGEHLSAVLLVLDQLGVSYDQVWDDGEIIIPDGTFTGRILQGSVKLPETEMYCKRVVAMYFIFSRSDILENYYIYVIGDTCYK